MKSDLYWLVFETVFTYLLWRRLGAQSVHADRADARRHVQRDRGWPGQTRPALCSEVNTSSVLLLNNWILLAAL